MRSRLIGNLTAVGRKTAAVITLILPLGSVAHAASYGGCSGLAVSLLRQYSPTGISSYDVTRDKSIFNKYSADCGDRNLFLDDRIITAVHETNHIIRAEQNAYHLASNQMVAVPPATNYFAPSYLVPVLAKNPKIRNDQYFQTYLSNGGPTAASSRDDFTYLLDEMNAYTNEMQLQIDLAPVHPITNRQGGVPAMMTFLGSYVAFARERAPKTWADLTASPASPTRLAVSAIWEQAERVLRRDCKLAPTSPNDDSAYIAFLCDGSQTSAISAVLGRVVQCPRECAADLRGPSYPEETTYEREELVR